MSILLRFPLPLTILLVLLLSVLISFFCLRFVKKKYPHEILKENHEVAGYIFNAFSIMFSVLVSFVVYINWSDYNQAQQNVYEEINSQSNIFHIAAGFPDSVRKQIQQSLLDYSKAVCYDEWNDMTIGKRSQSVIDAYNKLWDIFLRMDINSSAHKTLYEQGMSELSRLSDSRRQRYLYVENTIPGFVWFILIISAIMSISFTYLFGMKRRIPHYILVIAFTTVTILILFLIYVLDHPYMAEYMITPQPFKELINQMEIIIKAG
jgi:hypothetical protein